MNIPHTLLFDAALELGLGLVSVEPDGTMWLGSDLERVYLTEKQISAVIKKSQEIIDAKATAKEAVLAKLGLTADEVAALLS